MHLMRQPVANETIRALSRLGQENEELFSGLTHYLLEMERGIIPNEDVDPPFKVLRTGLWQT